MTSGDPWLTFVVSIHYWLHWSITGLSI
uniref:Uncharacterized protein n=1 Tax=Anguilla anguilla TaxID=7936 RepID=A0A0E9VMN1_ANGAN